MDDLLLKEIKGIWCPYCRCETQLVSGEMVYPKWTTANPKPHFLLKRYYMCVRNSDHYVGTYSDNKTSLGRVADKDLRALKKKGHELFDPMWKNQSHFKNQREAYIWLSEQMKLSLEFTHFGMFTSEQCNLAIQFCMDLV
jgi:hypothetical protein